MFRVQITNMESLIMFGEKLSYNSFGMLEIGDKIIPTIVRLET